MGGDPLASGGTAVDQASVKYDDAGHAYTVTFDSNGQPVATRVPELDQVGQTATSQAQAEQQLANERQANANAQDSNAQGWARIQQSAQSLALQSQSLALDQAKYYQDGVQFQQNLQYLQDKLDSENAANLRTDAQQTASLIEQQKARIQQNEQFQAQLQEQAGELQKKLAEQRAEFDAQMQAQVAGANADRALSADIQNASNWLSAAEQHANRLVTVAQTIQQAKAQNIDQQAQVAKDIASYVANPGDAAAEFAYLRARSGDASAISTGIANGKSAITDLSLSPLQMALGIQDQLRRPDPQVQSLLNQAVQPINVPFKIGRAHV